MTVLDMMLIFSWEEREERKGSLPPGRFIQLTPADLHPTPGVLGLTHNNTLWPQIAQPEPGAADSKHATSTSSHARSGLILACITLEQAAALYLNDMKLD